MNSRIESDTASTVRNEVHSNWCRQFRPTCCGLGPRPGDCPCVPCRASFAAGQKVSEVEIKRLRERAKQSFVDPEFAKALVEWAGEATIERLRKLLGELAKSHASGGFVELDGGLAKELAAEAATKGGG